jgi:hypothetical protein
LLLAAAGVTGGVFILYSYPPAENSYYPGCQFHSLTGLHCPGCGTTRALHAILHGQVAQALAYNAVAFVAMPVLPGPWSARSGPGTAATLVRRCDRSPRRHRS